MQLQRPAVLTPRTPRSPHGAEDVPPSPFLAHTPRTPGTPMFLLSPSADASIYQGGAAAAGAFHSTSEVFAAAGMTADLASLQALVAEQVQTVLGSAVGGDDPLMAAGLDSLGATELQQSLADTLGMELPSTLVFDYPTVNAMAEFLTARLSQSAHGGVAAPAALPAHGMFPVGASGAVAIVGAVGQPALLQQHSAGDASARVPYTRWDADSALITGDGTLAAQVSSRPGLGFSYAGLHYFLCTSDALSAVDLPTMTTAQPS